MKMQELAHVVNYSDTQALSTISHLMLNERPSLSVHIDLETHEGQLLRYLADYVG